MPRVSHLEKMSRIASEVEALKEVVATSNAVRRGRPPKDEVLRAAYDAAKAKREVAIARLRELTVVRKAEWADPAQKQEYVREYKRAQREEALPADRKCPCCGKGPILRSSKWVVRKQADLAGKNSDVAAKLRSLGPKVVVCLSCWRRA